MSEMLLNRGSLFEMNFEEGSEVNPNDEVAHAEASDPTPDETENGTDYDIIAIHSISKNKNNSDVNSNKTKKYIMYGSDIKRGCVELARSIDLKAVAKIYGVPLKSLKRWLVVGPDRLKGGGRKTRDPDMERKLIDWYRNYHLVEKQPVTSKMIKRKALEFSNFPDFHASKGWLEKLKKKYNLEMSRSLSASKISKPYFQESGKI